MSFLLIWNSLLFSVMYSMILKYVLPMDIFIFNDYPHVVRLYVLDLKSVL